MSSEALVAGRRRWISALVTVVVASGCSNVNNTQKGAGLGAVGGTALGAVVGHQFGATGAGAVVGGLAGTAFGALAGNAQDEADRRDHLARQVAYERAARDRRSYQMGNRDVLHMVSSGCSEKLVCETIRDRGGQFDLSPESVIQLHQYGVSDGVIAAMRKHNAYR
jgi:uncharacterized protein YcfJ